ncbi:acyltransferase [Scytonema hofmannii FACHB-248]|uniref:Acyltransferase n=2 Tax=Cyanophyceae TaxID=3028117 RepID=A0ABR8GPD3_9CYAN|nr:acyltransferase [Scytonema hofmannii FACHB-248]
MRERLHWVDYAKGIGIFLVVVGHVLRGLINSSILQPSALLLFVDRWIYGFHMPLFFFTSGLFVKRSLSKPFKHFLLDKLYVIVYPYFLWSLIQMTIQAVASRYTTTNQISLTNIWQIIYQPYQQFWFFYTLFAILIVYGILHKLKLSPIFFLIFALFLYCLHGLNVNFGTWGVLYLFRRHAIYFALGVIFGSGTWLSVKSQINHFALILITLGGYIAVALAVQFQLTENVIAIPLIGMFGIVATVALAVLLNKFNLLFFVKNWGIFSLEIFVAHIIAASTFRIALQKIFGLTEPVMHLVLGTAIGIYAPIALSLICSKLNFQDMFILRSWKKQF